MLLNVLKRLDVNGVSLDELMEAAAVARIVKTEYESRELELPEWFAPKVRTLNIAIEAKASEQRELEIRQLQRELDRITPAEERRAQLVARLSKLKGESKDQPVTA